MVGGEEREGVGGFGEAGVVYDYVEVGADGPEALIEEPVGVLGEGQAVVDAVVAGAGEGVDVGGVDGGD